MADTVYNLYHPATFDPVWLFCCGHVLSRLVTVCSGPLHVDWLVTGILRYITRYLAVATIRLFCCRSGLRLVLVGLPFTVARCIVSSLQLTTVTRCYARCCCYGYVRLRCGFYLPLHLRGGRSGSRLTTFRLPATTTETVHLPVRRHHRPGLILNAPLRHHTSGFHGTLHDT